MTSDASPADQQGQRQDRRPSADEVAAYLESHPEFFVGRDELVANLNIPHNSGRAISLLEHQVQVLRERADQSRQRLNALLDNARYNDQLFSVTRNLILTLLEENDPGQIASITEGNLATQPGIDVCALISVGTGPTPRAIGGDELRQRFPSLFRSNEVLCQPVDEEAATLLFPYHNEPVRSVALCPVSHDGELLGVMALGNHARDHFTEDLDTLFLSFIADVLGAIIGRPQSR